MDAAATPAPTPDTDPVGVIEAALVRLVDDVGVLAEEDVVRAFSIVKATDLPGYLRLRHAAKKANRDCSVTVLDKLVRDELPGSDDDASALDELVALAADTHADQAGDVGALHQSAEGRWLPPQDGPRH